MLTLLCVMFVVEQMFGRIDTDFARSFNHELGVEWTLMDPLKYLHKVIYYKSYSNPLLIDGWFDIRNFYGLNGQYQFLLRYVGESCFELSIYREALAEIS